MAKRSKSCGGNGVKITRTTGVLALIVAGTLTMAACGSDNNTTASSSSSSSSSSASSAAVGAASPAASGAMTSPDASGATTSSAMTSGSAPAGAAATFAGSGFTCATGTLRSSGSTAQGNAMSQWIKDYNTKCGATVNAYGGGGSGKGVSDFTSNQTDFGGSDSALKAAQFATAKSGRCAGHDAIDLPMVTGPIAVSYHLSGVSKLIMTPQVLVGIFGGKITNWNDPAIAKINPGVTLPTLAIATVHRSEASGTTDNFTKYLTAAGGWTFTGGKSWTAPGGTGAQGSDGVAKAISTTTGSIGYVEWGFAQTDKLAIAEIDNGSGAVALTAESAGRTVSTAKIVGTGKDLSLSIDYATKAAGAYPVILVTYEIVCSAGNGAKAALLKSFLGYAATDGQASLVALGSAPLPTAIQAKVVDAVKALS
jgi:phosphate transport system substrate-binding protein